MLSDPEMEYHIADAQQPKRNSGFVRCMAFVEGQSSHTRVATPDPIESSTLKIAAPEQPPGVKVASMEEARTKVATPSGASVTGDFSRPIRVSGDNGESSPGVRLKLYGSNFHQAKRR
jgi:hypothetical protein